jgi:pimeloyl-ACP methyl ester carboxylesterase
VPPPGPEYRGWLDRLIPAAFQQLVAGADTFCAVEFPSLQEWHFTREDAERVTQPVLGVFGAESASIWPGWSEIQGRLHEWLPQTEPFVLAGANHALEERDPRGVADAIAPFLARHPIAVAV